MTDPSNASSVIDTQQLESIEAEYLKLQEILERFDDRALTIKAWSVTLCTAGIGAAYVQKQPALFLVSSAAAILFWVIEALWKENQQAFYRRTYDIESASQAGTLLELKPFKIADSWSTSWEQRKKMWSRKEHRIEKTAAPGILYWPHVALPHVAVAVGGVFLFVAHSLWWEL